MKVIVSVFGRFHAFNLAQQLSMRECLYSLITTYPPWEAKKYGISSELTKSLWKLELQVRAWNRLPRWIRREQNLQLKFLENFDQEVVQLLSDSLDINRIDVFVGWSGACFESFRQAKRLNAVTVVERGSSHIAHQTKLLEEEYERWGLRFTATHPGVYERELQSYEEADRIAIPSLYVKRTFIEQGISEQKLIHVPYGTSLKEFYRVPKEDKLFRVIHCGGLSLRKGVQYLLQAFFELNLPDAELWLVGTAEPEILPFLNKYQSDRIIFKGKQSQNQLYWFYSQCSVFCLASIEEGLAMVQPQAMACGLPVIHTTNTGGKDIVREGLDGFCIPIRSVEALKEKILFFYDNPDRLVEMSSNALARAKDSLSWDDYGTKIAQAYQNLLVGI
jgi:glycosyltransferase involved in cell wall biosynthesis